jgi:hypothetical protein
MAIKMRSFLIGIFALVASAASAQAHTITYGWVAGQDAGEVDFWIGAYLESHGNQWPQQGSLQVEGIGGTAFAPVVKAFDTLTFELPSGLEFGENYFDLATTSRTAGVWQGVTIGGLTPGDYAMSLVGVTHITWVPWGGLAFPNFTLEANNIGSADVAAIPLPAPILLFLSALGLMGFLGWRKKRQVEAVA